MAEAKPRVALVTGAASGIGAAIGREIQDAGWRVTGFDLRSSDTDLSCTGDVTDPGALQDAVTRTEDALGPVAALVSVAGYYEIIPITQIKRGAVAPC